MIKKQNHFDVKMTHFVSFLKKANFFSLQISCFLHSCKPFNSRMDLKGGKWLVKKKDLHFLLHSLSDPCWCFWVLSQSRVKRQLFLWGPRRRKVVYIYNRNEGSTWFFLAFVRNHFYNPFFSRSQQLVLASSETHSEMNTKKVWS